MDNGTAILNSWLTTAVEVLQENAAELNRLDRAIGDGDHGANMLRGFRAAAAALDPGQAAPQNVKNVGMALVSHVGGAAGPLFGTFFLRAGQQWQEDLTTDVLAQAFRAGLDGVISRGRAKPGDATMVDALAPAVDSLEDSAAAELDLETAMTAAAEAARQGSEDTSGMVSKKGRAAAFGQASLGHVDPGAASSALLLGIDPNSNS